MQQTINGLANGGIYALIGLGVTLIWGILGVLAFSHAQIATWGTFATLWALNHDLPGPTAVVVGMIVGGLLYALMDIVVLELLRRRHAEEFSFVVATIGVAIILETVMRVRTNGGSEAFPRAGFPAGALHVAGLNIPWLQIVVLALSLAVAGGLGLLVNRTRFGTSLRAVAHSREVSELLGIDSRAAYFWAFLLSGALATLAGVFVAVTSASVSYSSNGRLLFIAIAVIVLGGMGSIKGAVIGGLALGLVEVYAVVYVSSQLRDAVANAFVLVVLVLRPQGLFGRAASTRV